MIAVETLFKFPPSGKSLPLLVSDVLSISPAHT